MKPTRLTYPDRRLIKELHEEYVRLMDAAQAVSPKALAQKFDVSVETIRRVLREDSADE